MSTPSSNMNHSTTVSLTSFSSGAAHSAPAAGAPSDSKSLTESQIISSLTNTPEGSHLTSNSNAGVAGHTSMIGGSFENEDKKEAVEMRLIDVLHADPTIELPGLSGYGMETYGTLPLRPEMTVNEIFRINPTSVHYSPLTCAIELGNWKLAKALVSTSSQRGGCNVNLVVSDDPAQYHRADYVRDWRRPMTALWACVRPPYREETHALSRSLIQAGAELTGGISATSVRMEPILALMLHRDDSLSSDVTHFNLTRVLNSVTPILLIPPAINKTQRLIFESIYVQHEKNEELDLVSTSNPRIKTTLQNMPILLVDVLYGDIDKIIKGFLRKSIPLEHFVTAPVTQSSRFFENLKTLGHLCYLESRRLESETRDTCKHPTSLTFSNAAKAKSAAAISVEAISNAAAPAAAPAPAPARAFK